MSSTLGYPVADGKSQQLTSRVLSNRQDGSLKVKVAKEKRAPAFPYWAANHLAFSPARSTSHRTSSMLIHCSFEVRNYTYICQSQPLRTPQSSTLTFPPQRSKSKTQIPSPSEQHKTPSESQKLVSKLLKVSSKTIKWRLIGTTRCFFPRLLQD